MVINKCAAIAAGVLAATLFAGPAMAQEVQVRQYGETPVTTAGTVQIREITRPPVKQAVGVSPFAFAIMPAAELPSADWDVALFRFSLFVGSHCNVSGIDIGLLGNFADENMSGLALSGLFNCVGSSTGALQIAGVCNRASWDFSGLQLAAGLSWTEGTHSGLQMALANKAGRLYGVQIGAVNVAETGSGLQFGVINYAEELEGFQIGALNFNQRSSVPCLPLINFAF